MSLPERLGRLERRRRIGVGGFATVWLYHDNELDSDVAVKALAENWAQRLDVRERFLDEARILRRADSDHVVHVYDVGEADETPYFVMTYADLGSVGTLLGPDEPLAPALALDLVEQAGMGLTVLHGHGVVHRDIKPQNLLLRSNGEGRARLLVADLGVAKALEHASGLTQVVGTPAFMAPEQAGGAGVDVRADVHALAAVAYRMLTGAYAREGSVADLARARRPEPPSTYAELSGGVDDVLMSALDPDPDSRPADIATFVRALREALDLPEPAEGASGPPRDTVRLPPPEPTLTRPWLLALVCVVVFAVTFAAAYAVTHALG